MAQGPRKSKIGTTMGGLEETPARKKRRAKVRKLKEERWAAKSGPVTVYYRDPLTGEERGPRPETVERSEFMRAELEEIKRIVREKQTAPADRQKTLRAKLRKLGFYISDYSDEPGFVESDVDDLIRRGTITVTD